MEKLRSSKIVFECPIFKVEEATVELPNGHTASRWYVVKRDAVGVVPISDTGEILLIREYRSAAGEYCWRIPAGGIEDGEDPAEAARREMREEIGFDSLQLETLLESKARSAMIKQVSHFFLARGLFPAGGEKDAGEDIEIHPTTMDDVEKLLNGGDIEGNVAAALRAAITRIRNTA
jgi:ADP-ribose pyrophosphatase